MSLSGRFPSKIALRLKKVCYELICVKSVSDKVVWPNYTCENDWWSDPFYLKFWIKLTALERNRRDSIYFRS